MSATIEIHVIPTCPYCISALRWLDTWKLPYNKIEYTDFTAKQSFYREHNVSTLPQIFVNNKRIGGWTDLCASDFKRLVETNQNVDNY